MLRSISLDIETSSTIDMGKYLDIKIPCCSRVVTAHLRTLLWCG